MNVLLFNSIVSPSAGEPVLAKKDASYGDGSVGERQVAISKLKSEIYYM